jgi:hypothetical protein
MGSLVERCQKPIPQSDAHFDALACRTYNLYLALRIISSRGGKYGFCGRAVLITVQLDVAFQIVDKERGLVGADVPPFQQVAEHVRNKHPPDRRRSWP